jgi:aminobenzoyl-glutamate utilization protein B
MIRRALVALAVLSPAAAPAQELPFLAQKQAAVASVDAHAASLVALADQVWGYAETALEETRSAELLASALEEAGFAVERGVAGLPTAFVASYGSGRPLVGLLGEYDALPGISQQALPERAPLVEGGAGHGCGHNLLGVGALGAALAVQERIAAGKLAGTVRFYGTPAEEAVGGKVYMARAGLFDDLDAVLTWHPDLGTRADTKGSQAMIDLAVEFTGRAAHAASDPWNGRSAADAAELFTHGLNLMREHVKPTVRMHYTLQEAGDVPNVVPEHARLWVWVRDSRMAGAEELLARVEKIVEGAALATETSGTVTLQSGSWDMLQSRVGGRRLHANLEWLGPLAYTPEEEAFAAALQAAAGVPQQGIAGELESFVENPGDPEGGSTDVADVSWLVPTVHLSVTTAPAGVPWHAWPVVAASRTSIGHKGMLLAAKALAATTIDLMADPEILPAMRTELEERRRGKTWKPWVPDGPPPVPTAE